MLSGVGASWWRMLMQATALSTHKVIIIRGSAELLQQVAGEGIPASWLIASHISWQLEQAQMAVL